MAENYIEMELREIQIVNNARLAQVVVLGEKEGPRQFPIYIGLNEATIMDSAVHGVRTPRPFSHDLILNVIDSLGAVLERVLVVKLEDSVFYGALELTNADGARVRVDARPSDALVLAVKRECPVFVEEDVLSAVETAGDENEVEELDDDADEDEDEGDAEDRE